MAPKLVYDDDCHFCTWSATFAVRRSDVVPVRLSEVLDGDSRLTEEERARLPDGFEECAQLVTDDAVYSCGAATERSLVRAGVIPAELVEFLSGFEDYEKLRERAYGFMSDHRDLLALAIDRDPPVGRNVPDSDLDPDERSPDE